MRKITATRSSTTPATIINTAPQRALSVVMGVGHGLTQSAVLHTRLCVYEYQPKPAKAVFQAVCSVAARTTEE